MAEDKYQNITDEQLKVMVHSKPSGGYLSESHKEEIQELEKRNRKKEEKIESQFSKSIRWGKIAAIAAIVGIILMITQILLSIYQYNIQKSQTARPLQPPKQNSQQSTKTQANEPPSKYASPMNTSPKNK